MNQLRLDSRRTFCRHIALGLATSLVGGKVLRQALLVEARAQTGPAPGSFTLKLSDYPALATAPGSLVLNLPDSPAALAAVVVTRLADDQYFAVDSTCAHNQCMVNPYNAVQGAIVCSCHGSRYQANGQLLQGPAQRGLRAFNATVNAPNELTVLIPEMRFALKAASAQIIVGGSPRIRLEFPGLAFFSYQVFYRSSLQQPWGLIPFARFPTTALDNTEIPGIGADIQIYVSANQSAGFYKIIALG